jgi:hypothetical protein
MFALVRKVLYRGFSPLWFARKLLVILVSFPEYLRRRRSKKDVSLNRYIQKIREDGYTLIDSDANEHAVVIAYCREISRKIDPHDQPPIKSGGKDFWRLLVNENNLADHPVILEFAKKTIFKSIASNYLGQEAELSTVTLMKSHPAGEDYSHSQLWHLDADDSKNLLFYLYINDVDNTNGPFELVPRSSMKPIFTPRFLRKYALTDRDLREYVHQFSVVAVTGASGTMFACDTCTVYHRGSRCESSVRLALSIRYQTFSGLYPFYAK